MILIAIQFEILKIEADFIQLCRKRRGTSRELNLIGPFLAFHPGAQNGLSTKVEHRMCRPGGTPE